MKRTDRLLHIITTALFLAVFYDGIIGCTPVEAAQEIVLEPDEVTVFPDASEDFENSEVSDAPKAPDEEIEAQLRLIAANYHTWNLYENEDLWGATYSFAVSDVDGNGRLELMLSFLSGSGFFSSSRIWEVNESRTGMDICFDTISDYSTDWGADLSLVEETTVYVQNGRRIILAPDHLRNGWASSSTTIDTFSLQNGSVQTGSLGYSITNISNNENDYVEETEYHHSDGSPMTAEEFETLADDAFPDAAKGKMCFLWISNPDQEGGVDFERDLPDLLRKSWEGFSCDLRDWLWTVREEKGKTILEVTAGTVQADSAAAWRLEAVEGSKRMAFSNSEYLLTSGNKYTMEYDFSTDLQLDGGSYEFTIVSDTGKIVSEPYLFEYDEEIKTEEDDPYGNEREYRRLFASFEEPLEEAAFRENMTDRLKNAGFSDEKAGEIISRLERSENPYRELYLYSFYMYTFKYGGDGLFITKANSIELGENAVQDFFNKEEFYTKFFHESGHAIDYNTGNNEYYTVQLESDSIWDAMSKDLKNAVEEQVINWLQENPEAVLCTRDELTQKICDKLYSSDTEITREDCPEFSGNEYKAYQYVEKKLKDRMPLWETLRIGANVDMRDTFQGCTANKVSKGIGDLSAGHSADYWWSEAGNNTIKVLTESWAEFYAAMFLASSEAISSNEDIFPNTCAYYKGMVEKMLTVLKEKY